MDFTGYTILFSVFLICPFVIIQKQSLTTRNKKRNRYKHTIDRFKIVADKDMRKMSNIVETKLDDMLRVGFKEKKYLLELN
jgi:hypothetical protein